jgi:hypothetical protein
MNTVLVLVMLVLVIFALKEGMVWVALGVGLLMVLLATSESSGGSKNPQKFMYGSDQLPPITSPKEQMPRVKYQPKWDGNNWWEEMADHWGTSLGRTIGLIR